MLDTYALNPISGTSLGNFGSQLLAATINLAFSELSLRTSGNGLAPGQLCGDVDVPLADLVFVSNNIGVPDVFEGLTVGTIVAWAHGLVCTGTGLAPSGTPVLPVSDWVATLNIINLEFDNCAVGRGYLACPPIY